jgi:hypothetical protein
MNILDYKINEEKLQTLIDEAESKGLTDIHICLNYKTLRMIDKYYFKNNLFIKKEDLKELKNDGVTAYYAGYPFMYNNDLDIGEVVICGIQEKECTRVTFYRDGTHPKIENGVTELVAVQIG